MSSNFTCALQVESSWSRARETWAEHHPSSDQIFCRVSYSAWLASVCLLELESSRQADWTHLQFHSLHFPIKTRLHTIFHLEKSIIEETTLVLYNCPKTMKLWKLLPKTIIHTNYIDFLLNRWFQIWKSNGLFTVWREIITPWHIWKIRNLKISKNHLYNFMTTYST